jgi:iron complex outermembrane receptor protein
MISIKRCFYSCLLFVSAALAATANDSPQTGAITGRVFNPTTGEYVRSAQIRVLSTSESTNSGDGGFYRFGNVPAGDVSVELNYIGYPSITATISVVGGQTTSHDFTLARLEGDDDAVVLTKFVVSGEREGNAKAIMEQRNSLNIVNHIASDVFGDNAEGNIGEFLRNVPGVSLDTVNGEVRNVGLGGLGSEYTQVTVDGMAIGAADANDNTSRAASFEMVSLSSMDSLEVSRTVSADVDANAPAGTINLRPKRAFDRMGRRIILQSNVAMHNSAMTLSKSYGPNDHSSTHKYTPGGIFEYSDVVFNRRLGFVINVSESNVYTDSSRVTINYNRSPTQTDPRLQVPTSIVFQQLPRHNRRFSTTLTTDFRATENLVLSMSAIYNYSELWNMQRSVTATTGGRSVIGDNPEHSFTTNATAAQITVNPVSISKMGETITLTPKFEYKKGGLTWDGAFSYSSSDSWYENFDKRGTLQTLNSPVATNVNFTATRPNDRLSPDWQITQISGKDISQGSSFSKPSIIAKDSRFSNAEFITAQTNATFETNFGLPITWKTGLKSRQEKRIFTDERALDRVTFTGAHYGDYASEFPWDLGKTNVNITSISGGKIFMPDLADLGKLYRTNPELFTNTSNATDYYNTHVVRDRNFKERIDAAYLMGTSQYRGFTLRAGLRYEDTSTSVLEPDSLSSAEVIAAGYPVTASTGIASTIPGIDHQFFSRPRVNRRGDYDNFFPSASVRYEIIKDLEWHIGYSSTIRRPSYNNLAGVWVVNDNNQTVTAPNLNLKPETAENFATRLAYYTKSVGEFSVALYQNNVTDLINASELTAADFGYTGGEYDGYRFITSANTPGKVQVRSLEFSYNQNLAFLGTAFKRFNVRANYTRSYASQLKTMLIPHSVNSGLSYHFRRFNTYVNANWTDSFPTTSTGATYRYQRTQVDAGAGWKFSRILSLSLSARNLNDAPYIHMQHVPPSGPTLQDHLRVGTTYTLALKATF